VGLSPGSAGADVLKDVGGSYASSHLRSSDVDDFRKATLG